MICFKIAYRELNSHYRGEVIIEAESESKALNKFIIIYPYAIYTNIEAQ